MGTILGLLGLVVFVVGVLALSAALTFTVVKLTPRREEKPPA
jgi:hypothetical protein